MAFIKSRNPGQLGSAGIARLVLMRQGKRPAFFHFDIDTGKGIFHGSCSGILAETCNKYLQKGHRVLVSGNIQADGRIDAREIKYLKGDK